MKLKTKTSLGKRAEESVHKYLKKQGLKSIAKNYLCKAGEIDLIMMDQGTLVFIEVKYRSRANYGSSAAQVTLSKQQKLEKAALRFLAENVQYQSLPCRFDVAGASGEASAPGIHWIKGAFYAQHSY